MGLRINTNIPSLIALRNLDETNNRMQVALQRLATGLRINSAKDDPTGVALADGLRSEIRALDKANQNAGTANDMLTTADAAIGQINDVLNEVRRSLIFGMDGTATPEQKAAEQSFVDNSLASVRRIADTTRFGQIPLLNGNSGFNVQNVPAQQILAVQPTSVQFNPVTDPTTFTLQVTSVATQATAAIGSVAGGDVVLRITGPIGTSTLNLPSGSTAAQVAGAIDSVRGFTGVFTNGVANMFTEQFGTAARLRLEQVGGSGAIVGGQPAGGLGAVFTAQGTNAVANFQGTTLSGVGNTLSINVPTFAGRIVLNPAVNQDPVRGAGTTGTFTFTIARSGMLFQLGSQADASGQAITGIQNMSPDSLGRPFVIIGGQTTDGFLSSLQTGGGNDLFTNPANGLRIADIASADVGRVRSNLGSFVSEVVQPTQAANQVAGQNLQAAESQIRDVDTAAEVAEQTRDQVFFQAGIGVLGQANSVPQSVLRLLEK